MMRLLMIGMLVVSLLLSAGCGSFWADQGAASRTAAEARLRAAEAERQNARAAIIDAEARGALAESQARALTTAMSANADLTRQAIRLADNSEYVLVLAAVTLAALVLAGVVIILQARRPVVGLDTAGAPAVPALERGITIETPAGRVRLVQEADETRYHFMLRAAALAAAMESAQQLLVAAQDQDGERC